MRKHAANVQICESSCRWSHIRIIEIKNAIGGNDNRRANDASFNDWNESHAEKTQTIPFDPYLLGADFFWYNANINQSS